MTWLTGWTYRNAHRIRGSSAGVQTDYPVGIKVYYGSGADGTEVIGGATFGKVYCNSKCKTDFGDIRFTKSDEISLLDYWVEEQVDSDYAIIWVEVDSIPGGVGTVEIYIYYGNAGASTMSNADDVFLIFNDCTTTTGWSVETIVGTPAWGAVVEDGVDTIYIEANAHEEKLRIQYDPIPMTGRENRRALTRMKHTSWNPDGYFHWYTPLLIGSPSQYDSIRYSSYFNYYTIYASVGGVADTTNYNVAHPIGWYRYEKKTNAAGEVTGYRDDTELGTSTVDGDYSGGKVMFYVNEWNSGLTKHYIDWFAIAKYVDPEPTHIRWGGETTEGEGDLAAGFWVRGGYAVLPAGFRLRQDVADLPGNLQVTTRLPLPAKFVVIRTASPVDIPARFDFGSRRNIPAQFRVTKFYDLEGTGGIAFYWWGAANPVEAMNQLILESPTGFWYTDFYDGPAAWRLVEIPWGNFTWVSAPQRRLEPHRYWPYPPDKTMIDGFIWTVHTHGHRRLDYVYAYPRGPTNLHGEFDIRQTAAPVELLLSFVSRHADSQELACGFNVVIPDSTDLPAGFRIRADIEELPAELIVRTIGSQDLEGKLFLGWEAYEDFEDGVLDPHYQHVSGPGARSSSGGGHTGSWHWRTPDPGVDLFDLTGGRDLAGVELTVWERYGSSSSPAIILELLDEDLNVMDSYQRNFQVAAYALRTLKAGNGVKYFRVTNGSGYADLRTDDITITWASITSSESLACGFTVRQGISDMPGALFVGSEELEDFSTYSEVDSAGDITRGGPGLAPRVTYTTMRRDADSYVYKDYGADFFGDFEFDFKCVTTNVEAGDTSSRPIVVPIAASNHLSAGEGFGDGAGESVTIVYLRQQGSADDKYQFIVWQREDGVTIGSELGAYRAIGTVYCTFGRKGTEVYLRAYSDAARTVLLDDLSFVGSAVYKYRYLMATVSWDSSTDPSDHGSGYVEMVDKKRRSANLACGFDIA